MDKFDDAQEAFAPEDPNVAPKKPRAAVPPRPAPGTLPPPPGVNPTAPAEAAFGGTHPAVQPVELGHPAPAPQIAARPVLPPSAPAGSGPPPPVSSFDDPNFGAKLTGANPDPFVRPPAPAPVAPVNPHATAAEAFGAYAGGDLTAPRNAASSMAEYARPIRPAAIPSPAVGAAAEAVTAARTPSMAYRAGRAVSAPFKGPAGKAFAGEMIIHALDNPDAVMHPIDTAGKVLGGIKDSVVNAPSNLVSLPGNLSTIYSGLTSDNPEIKAASHAMTEKAIGDTLPIHALNRVADNTVEYWTGQPRWSPDEMADRALQVGGNMKLAGDAAAMKARQEGDAKFQFYSQPHTGAYPGDVAGQKAIDKGNAEQAANLANVAKIRAMQAAGQKIPGEFDGLINPQLPPGQRPPAPAVKPVDPATEKAQAEIAQAAAGKADEKAQAEKDKAAAVAELDKKIAAGQIPPADPRLLALGNRNAVNAFNGQGGPQMFGQFAMFPGGHSEQAPYDPDAGIRAQMMSDLRYQIGAGHFKTAAAMTAAMQGLAQPNGHPASAVDGANVHKADLPDPLDGTKRANLEGETNLNAAKANQLNAEAEMMRGKGQVLTDPVKLHSALLAGGASPEEAEAGVKRMVAMQAQQAAVKQLGPEVARFDDAFSPANIKGQNVGAFLDMAQRTGVMPRDLGSPAGMDFTKRVQQAFGADALQRESQSNPQESWIPFMSDRNVPERQRARQSVDDILANIARIEAMMAPTGRPAPAQ